MVRILQDKAMLGVVARTNALHTLAAGKARPGPVEHEVKSWPELFEATRDGRKKHDMRRISDRDYRVGDILKLREFDPHGRHYTGRELRVRITYITSPDQPCALSEGALDLDYCILSIQPLDS
jgi:hypothetical protein